VPDHAVEPDLPEEKWDPFWEQILPPTLDLHQFSRRDVHLDVAGYEPAEVAKTLAQEASGPIDDAAPKSSISPCEQQPDLALAIWI
jgi:hypothetical protein